MISSILIKLTNPANGYKLLAYLMITAYTIFPIMFCLAVGYNESYVNLAVYSLLSSTIILCIGSYSFSFGKLKILKIRINPNNFIQLVFLFFFIFALVAWVTADRIPLVAAIQGGSVEQLAILREQFLKARVGWQSVFVYINAILTGALIPYALSMLFCMKSKKRWYYMFFFLFYCLSFLEKAYFMKAVLPLLILISQNEIKTNIKPNQFFLLILIILFLISFASGAGDLSLETNFSLIDFFSIDYVPDGTLLHLFWRALIIPFITAGDAISVFNNELNSQIQFGATSNLLAFLFNLNHLDFERMVFSNQWGQNETSTGSANSVFITEALVNFGLTGVVLFSILVGAVMRWYKISSNASFRATYLIFIFGVFTSGLIGTLFSNGFLLLFLMVLFTNFKQRK